MKTGRPSLGFGAARRVGKPAVAIKTEGDFKADSHLSNRFQGKAIIQGDDVYFLGFFLKALVN